MRSLTEEALGGFSAGVIGTVIGYPLDVIKTHMQTSSGATTSTSFWRIGSSLVRTQGIFALYRGVLSPLLSLGLVNTLNFGSYSYFQALVGGHRGLEKRRSRCLLWSLSIDNIDGRDPYQDANAVT
jgi:hypothetical protein